MSEDTSREQGAHQKEQHSEHISEPVISGFEGLLAPESLPSYFTSLAGDPRLNDRGNQPVRIAVLQRMQQTYGNRAVRRFIQRSATAGGPLPNAKDVPIDIRKLEDYSMDPKNPNNQGKSEAWKALGYDVDSPDGRSKAALDAARQLKEQIANTPATSGKKTDYVQKYEVRTTVVGPNGKQGTLVTVWQVDKGTTVPRMITNWVEVHK